MRSAQRNNDAIATIVQRAVARSLRLGLVEMPQHETFFSIAEEAILRADGWKLCRAVIPFWRAGNSAAITSPISKTIYRALDILKKNGTIA